MEKFAKKHYLGIIIAAAFFICTTIALSIFIYFDFSSERELNDYTNYLNHTEMRNAARKFIDSTEEEDKLGAYHNASMAAVYASRYGDTDTSAFFVKIADRVKNEDIVWSEIADEVLYFVDTGKLPEKIKTADNLQESDEKSRREEVSQLIYGYKFASAQKTANEIFGLNGVLSGVTKSTNGELIFSCKNAYVIIDAISGNPIQAAISVPMGVPILSQGECVNLSRKFLYEFFTNEIASSAVVCDVYPDESGAYEIVYTCRDIKMFISVKRDTGKIVRFILSR